MAVELMTRQEAQAFADKLEQFAMTLPPKEQALLHEILLRAAGADDDDVEGHARRGFSIAGAALAAAAAIGVTADANTAHVIATIHAQPVPHATGDGSPWLEVEHGGVEHTS
jgi:hypothetical protein